MINNNQKEINKSTIALYLYFTNDRKKMNNY